MLVYREGRRTLSGPALGARLLAACEDRAALISALMLAGELECGIADASSASNSETVAAEITDLIAGSFLARDSIDLPRAFALLKTLKVPAELRISVPEGFAYYALHPRSYAELVKSLPAPEAAVIGIRSIGTTLSAVVCAVLRARGARAERVTVRPQGHPFDRKTEFSRQQRSWLQTFSNQARFLIVDEGPGLSGSSLLSVAEALEREDIPAGRIHLLCGHAQDANRLCARAAAARWSRYHVHPCPPATKPAAAEHWIGGGEWRERWLRDLPRELWPAVWKSVERNKFLSADGVNVFKFEGFGRYGKQVVARWQALADAGLSPPVASFDPESGYARYQFVPGRCATLTDISEQLLRRLAAYIAARAELFPAEGSRAELEELAAMMRVNAQKALGVDLREDHCALPIVRPTICDARLMPHEWIIASDGRTLKIDAAAHGDDHFFPGPCDIAWDLAGAIVEWQLAASASELLLNEYRRLTNDDARARLENYLLAYSLFRLGHCTMAAGATDDAEERQRLERAASRYRPRCATLIEQTASAMAQISG